MKQLPKLVPKPFVFLVVKIKQLTDWIVQLDVCRI